MINYRSQYLPLINRLCRFALRAIVFVIVQTLSFAHANFAQAEKLFVVVNPEADLQQLNRGEVINLFMGRSRKLDQNSLALPLDIANNNDTKAAFYQMLVNRDLPEINSYWTRVMFAGDASPPRQVSNFDQVRQLIRDNRGTIAYFPESELEKFDKEDFKVVFVLSE